MDVERVKKEACRIGNVPSKSQASLRQSQISRNEPCCRMPLAESDICVELGRSPVQDTFDCGELLRRIVRFNQGVCWNDELSTH